MSHNVLSGTLSSFRLPDVLTFLSTTRQSGTLTVASDAKEASLFFEGGALVYASSNQEHLRLGAVLQRRRRLTAEQRQRIDDLIVREGGRFGQLALQTGVLTEAQLRDYLKVQVSEIVFDAFVWETGMFTFFPQTNLPSWAVTIAIELPNLIMEGARRIEEREQFVKLLPDRHAVFRVVTAPKDDKITLSADEWKILFLINGVRTLEDLCRDCDDDELTVYRVLYGLLANHLVELAPRKELDFETGRATSSAPDAADDATIRQGSPQFGSEATVREAPGDDTSLLVSSDARLSYADVVRPTIAQITIVGGENAGHVTPLSEPEYLVGRHRDNTILLTDLGVSGFHARIYRGADGYIIEDLKSRNGTWVNGNRVYHATLAHGDRIHVGQSDLLYEVLF